MAPSSARTALSIWSVVRWGASATARRTATRWAVTHTPRSLSSTGASAVVKSGTRSSLRLIWTESRSGSRPEPRRPDRTRRRSAWMRIPTCGRSCRPVAVDREASPARRPEQAPGLAPHRDAPRAQRCGYDVDPHDDVFRFVIEVAAGRDDVEDLAARLRTLASG